MTGHNLCVNMSRDVQPTIYCPLPRALPASGNPIVSLFSRHQPLDTKSFLCHTSENCDGNSLACHTFKNAGFKVLCLPHFQKMAGGAILLAKPVAPALDRLGSLSAAAGQACVAVESGEMLTIRASDYDESVHAGSRWAKRQYTQPEGCAPRAYVVRCTKMPEKCSRWRTKRITHKITTTMASGRPRLSMSRWKKKIFTITGPRRTSASGT